MNLSTTSAPTHIVPKSPDRRRVSFSDIPDEPIPPTVPLLLQPVYARSKSVRHDELRNFRISLKWYALDHSSCANKFVSYFTFVVFAVVVPVLCVFSIHVPPSATAVDQVPLNKLVQLPESSLATIAFFTLARFLSQSGLRQLLFLDGLEDDSEYVRCGYARELDKAFRHLPYILLPSFFVELVHKVIFFSTVSVSLPPFLNGVPSNSVVFVALLASWVYRTGVFLLVCVFFRLTCELQLLRFEGFKQMFEGCESDAGVMFQEHMRIRKQLSVTSHMYRFFIIACFVTITISQFGALFLILASKSQKTFFNSGDLVVCSAVQLSGFFLCLMGAVRITHRAQGVVSPATKWHMRVTTASKNGPDVPAGKRGSPGATGNHHCRTGSSDHALIIIPTHDPASDYQTRVALVTYLQHNNGGITLFGFTLDRGLLHTIFAFEFSLVLWILSKVVVLSY